MALKILLADDSMAAQKMGQKILSEAGHEVIAVSNGAAAMKKIAQSHPDLLVLDVFMPGYSGVEVCQKIRGEGSAAPVLLTVGQMEHFDPAEGERVKADGVIVKPFVAKDLEELVRKIEEKLKAPPAAAAYEDTQKIHAQEFKDASYEEWKVTAEDHVDHAEEEAPAEAKLEVPKEMASAAAFGDLLGEELHAAEAAPAHEIEFTSAPKAEEVRVQRAAELEPTIRAAEVVHTGGMDPALITDATEMASAFPTKFGVEGAEVVPVGVAADMPELYADAQASAEAPAEAAPAAEAAPDESERVTQEITAPPAEPAPVMEAAPPPAEPKRITQEIVAPPPEMAPTVSAEDSRSLEQEMQQAFGNLPVEAAPPAEEPPPPPPVVEAAAPPAAAPANAPDAVLAAAMQAAVSSPAGGITLDANTIASIVQRVTDRMKPELISEIAKELAAEAERTRKP